MGRAVLLPPRFRAQVFSTSQRFPGHPEFHGLVSCRNRSWASSCRAFPSQGSRTPLEAASFLAVIQRRAWTSRRQNRSPGFPDVRAIADAVAWFPRGFGSPFREPKLTSRSPEIHRPRNRPVPPPSPASKPSSPCESVHPATSFPAAEAVALLGFSPSEVPSRTSEPRPTRTLEPEHAPSPAGSGPRLEGPAALRVR
jgi:hypothetical protein